ncbi:hypothetical protein SELMODRAFT_432450 [Selaginella moellendorffii]|uniref:NADP-dependent glyceraldehyde-3-phosphate dehydrogenase n=1 Tax=Selaginella moellendorffii TaxID=88036 RepID=D8TG16_SELML|nr:hypothetical protein SELMODRAFT_432450 [Selaginella moellendorffii]
MLCLYVRGEVKDALITAVKKLKGGDPRQDDMSIGPKISKSTAAIVEKSMNDRHNRQPMILEDAPFDTDARKEEIFGPMILLYSYNDFKEAVKEANNTHYGLQSGIFMHDLNKAFYAFEHIEAGGVCLNDSPSMRVDSQPYGGIKDSGIQSSTRWMTCSKPRF